MKIPSGLDFSNIKEKKVFDSSSKEYKKMINMDDEFEWKEYTNEMLSKGVSIIYDASGDFFLAKPVAFKESKMKQKILRKEKTNPRSIKVGDTITWLNEHNSKQKGVVLEYENSVISVYNSLTGEVQDVRLNESKEDRYLLYDDNEEGEDIDLESSHDDLISLSQDDLNNDYDDTPEEIETPNQNDTQPVQGSLSGFASGQVSLEDLQRIVSEIMSGKGSGAQVQVDDKFHSGEAGTVDQSTEATNDILGSEFAENQTDVANVESKIENEETYLEYLQGDLNQVDTVAGKEFEIYEEPSETEFIQEDEDLEILSPAEYEDGDLDSPEVLEPANIVEPGSTISHRGVPVKVQITGWLITVPEVNSLAESVYKSGGKLRGLGSKSENKLTLVVESNKKLYKILYEDRSRTETQKPWSVGKLHFTSLTEAVKNINKNKISDKERYFKKLIGESTDLRNRNSVNIKESDIFADFKNVKYTAGWNVKAVGPLDLKKGLNEVYSNITEGSKAKNTLFKTKSGQYYLIKGNLGEGSQKGTKKELLDLEGRRNYGEGQVVGIYENTIKGLGQIMFKIRKTSIPMMVWK